jgi:hypothetical protein
MKKNVGGVDRVIRAFIGIVVGAVGILAPMGVTLRVILLAVAFIALLTSAVSF